jgi:hypothetical protein
MAETPEEFYERVANHLRMPPVHEWETFPFDGDLRQRRLQSPVDYEKPRYGEGGVDCQACAKPDADYLWTAEQWRLRSPGPTGLPVILLLEPRLHYAEPGDLPDELAAECGVLIGASSAPSGTWVRLAASTFAAGAMAPNTSTGGSWPVLPGSRN